MTEPEPVVLHQIVLSRAFYGDGTDVVGIEYSEDIQLFDAIALLAWAQSFVVQDLKI
jgi:hypothetical protein